MKYSCHKARAIINQFNNRNVIMKISLLNELFIFTGTLEKFNLNGSRIDDLHASFLPSTWSKARSLRSQPVARYLLNHNTASRVKKKKKKKTKQAIKGQRRLRAIPFNESTPCSREGRHSSSLTSLNADNGREIGEITRKPSTVSRSRTNLPFILPFVSLSQMRCALSTARSIRETQMEQKDEERVLETMDYARMEHIFSTNVSVIACFFNVDIEC